MSGLRDLSWEGDRQEMQRDRGTLTPTPALRGLACEGLDLKKIFFAKDVGRGGEGFRRGGAVKFRRLSSLANFDFGGIGV
jgi:hypothetical protein